MFVTSLGRLIGGGLALLLAAGTASAVLFLAEGTASAQSQEFTDPDPGSPPGEVYELPVDKGRRDAAPNGGGSGSGGSGGGGSGSGGSGGSQAGLPSSSLRSENNFGTSSLVPGDPRRGGSGGQDGGGSGVQAGDGKAADGTGEDEVSGIGASAFDTGDPSEPYSYVLLALIIAIGLLLGVALARSRRST
jgi:hypothetical protein